MSLTDKDLEAIKDIVEFSIEKSEQNMEGKIDALWEEINERFDQVDERFNQMDHRFDQVDVSIDSLIETDQFILDKMGGHEERVTRLEVKTGLKHA